ncbi:coagulation factor VIII [Homo sapiens]|uniref:Coagulation factor VIII n=1 Tax=Homo sapiens TaxID=9606 RepID=A0A2R8Y7J7_HUMAN|nr:coagulation factor VIII [Homo sapiens]KAI4001689.1 coagulation factor VIII [Homo sapiens]
MQIELSTCFFLCLLRFCFSATRRYYLGAVELSWDYMQSDLDFLLECQNLFHSTPQSCTKRLCL